MILLTCRDLEECNSLDESVENLDRNSLASFGSGNTTDSDKVSNFLHTSITLYLKLISTV